MNKNLGRKSAIGKVTEARVGAKESFVDGAGGGIRLTTTLKCGAHRSGLESLKAINDESIGI